MNDTDTIELRNIDPEDISDVLAKIQKSFGFKFGDNELKDVKTFGELCEIILSKVRGDNLNDCTTQQSFYKLRNAIAKTQLIEKSSIMTQSNLQILFPRSSRRQKMLLIDSELGFRTKVLRPKHWLTGTIALTFIISFIGLFVYWQAGLGGIILSILSTFLSDKFGNELDLQTVGQFARKISREHYQNVRSRTGTINKNEIVQFVKELFSHDLDLDQSALTKEAVFV